MADVCNFGTGRGVSYHRLTDCDVLVGQPEVGEEGYLAEGLLTLLPALPASPLQHLLVLLLAHLLPALLYDR
jgi:hypothetical protein